MRPHPPNRAMHPPKERPVQKPVTSTAGRIGGGDKIVQPGIEKTAVKMKSNCNAARRHRNVGRVEEWRLESAQSRLARLGPLRADAHPV
jgi:hypothetical protein